MKNSYLWRQASTILCCSVLVAGPASAAEPPTEAPKEFTAECAAFAKDVNADLGEVLRAGCEPTLAQMSALMDNPLGNVAMLFTQFDYTRMENPSNDKTAMKGNYMGIAQFPKKLNDDWNLINRVVWNVPSMPLDQDEIDAANDRRRQLASLPGGDIIAPSSVPPAIDLFDGRTTGFGDMYYNGLFSPSEGAKMGEGRFVWGAGLNFGFPTATEDILGTGKWLGGPSALAVYLGKKWKVGGLAQQYYDIADEDDDREDVNLMNFQYFVFYDLDETSSIGAAPNIIADWRKDSDNAYTVPIGIGYTKTVQFGKVPVRFGAELHYSVIQPDDVPGAEWNFRFYVIPAAPSALFSWMQ
jgi:hypothetical protein